MSPESERSCNLAAKVAALEAVIKAHDLCHDLHGKVGRAEFEEGCRRETVKEYGSCGWAERIAELEAALKPFADFAATTTPGYHTDAMKVFECSSTPTIGDCRRAAELLARKGGK